MDSCVFKDFLSVKDIYYLQCFGYFKKPLRVHNHQKLKARGPSVIGEWINYGTSIGCNTYYSAIKRVSYQASAKTSINLKCILQSAKKPV